MRRRRFLATVGVATTSFAGCLGDIRGSTSDGSPSPAPAPAGGTSPGTNNESEVPTPTGSCGTAAAPQSARFVDEGGGPPTCYEGAETSVAIENERDETVAVSIEITSDRGRVFENSYTLPPDERTVERDVLPAHEEHTASVTVDGEEPVSGEWDDVSCYRHGISITPTGVQFGLVPPLSGPGDTQHDCYAGDDVPITIRTSDAPRTVTVTVVDNCEETAHERTLTLEPGDVERIRDVLVSGGMYDIVVATETGAVATYSFYDECWGVAAGIDGDGDVTIHQILID